MLQPEYFNDKANELIEIYDQFQEFLLRDIAMRILKSGDISGTTDREIWKLEQIGLHNEEILKQLSKLTGMSEENMRELLQNAVLTSWEDDAATLQQLGITSSSPLENPYFMSIIDAEWQKTRGELGNLTRTTMLQSQSDLIGLLNEVDFRVASGVQSYSSAICEVLDRYAGSGIRVNYPNGSQRSLEAAVRCAVVTSMNQTAAQVTNQYIVKNNIEYVWVSEHVGARYDKKDPQGIGSHDWWQGKAYKIVGNDDGFPNLLESTGYTIDPETGIGTVVNPLGLHGYNCRHTHGPWAKELGTMKPKIDREKSQKIYDLQQKQRAMERAIRKTKRELMVKQMEVKAYPNDIERQMEYQKLAVRYENQNDAYNMFCEKNKLVKQSDRLKVAGFGRSEAGRAVANARKHGIIKLNLQYFSNKSKQYGKKIGKHAIDYGLDVTIESDRLKMMRIIDDIREHYDSVRIGRWNGQPDDVLFYIKGNDVVITKQNGEFITILKDGVINSEGVKKSRKHTI